MFNLKDALKEKINKRAEMLKSESGKKCSEARELLNQASQDNDSEKVYQAASLYIQAGELFPENLEAYLGLAYICWKFDNNSQAIMLLNKASELDPLNPSVREMLMQVQSDAKNEKFKQISQENTKKRKSIELDFSQSDNKKGLFRKIIGFFSPHKSPKLSPSPSKTSNQKFMTTVGKIQKEVMNYEQITAKVSPKTLNKLNKAIETKEHKFNDSMAIYKLDEIND